MEMQSIIEESLVLKCGLKIEYLMPSDYKVVIYVLPINLSNKVLKAKVLDLKTRQFSMATYVLHRITNITLVRFLTADFMKTVIADYAEVHRFNQLRFSESTMKIETKNINDNILEILPKLPFNPSYYTVFKAVISIQINDTLYPLIIQRVKYNATTQNLTYSDPFIHHRMSYEKHHVNLDKKLPYPLDLIFKIYLENPDTFIKVMQELTDFTIEEDGALFIGVIQETSLKVFPASINKKTYHPIDLLFNGLKKTNLGKKTYKLPLKDDAHPFIPMIHAAFKDFYSEIYYDHTFKRMKFLKTAIETALINDEKMLIVFEDETELKAAIKELNSLDFPPLILSNEQLHNYDRQIVKDLKQLNPYPKCNKLLEAEEDYEQQLKIQSLNFLLKMAKTNHQFTLMIKLESLINQLSKETLSKHFKESKLKALNKGINVDDYLLKTYNQHFERIETVPYKPIKQVLYDKSHVVKKQNQVEALIKHILKNKRLTQLFFSLYPQIVTTKLSLDLFVNTSNFHTTIAFNTHKYHLLDGLKILSKTEHFTSVNEQVDGTNHNHFLRLDEGLTSNLVQRIHKTTPYFPAYSLRPIYFQQHKEVSIIPFDSTYYDHPHTNENHFDLISNYLVDEGIILTLFNEDKKRLKHAFNKRSIQIESLHQVEQFIPGKFYFLHIPIHKGTPLKTYHWMKNHPSIIKVFNNTAPINLTVFIEQTALKTISDKEDMLYYFIMSYSMNQKKHPSFNKVLKIFENEVYDSTIEKTSQGECIHIKTQYEEFTLCNYNNLDKGYTYDKVTFSIIKWLIQSL